MLASKPKNFRGRPRTSNCKKYRTQSKFNIFNKLLIYSSWKMLNNIMLTVWWKIFQLLFPSYPEEDFSAEQVLYNMLNFPQKLYTDHVQYTGVCSGLIWIRYQPYQLDTLELRCIWEVFKILFHTTCYFILSTNV